MVNVFVGFIIGIVAAYAGLKYQDRLPLPIRRRLARLVVAQDCDDNALPSAALEDIADDPDLAKVINAEPEVPLSSVPETLTASEQERIADAPDGEAALMVARRYIPDEGLAEAVTCLVRWRTRRGNDELQYQNSFRAHARRNGYADRLEEKRRIPWGGGGGNRTAIPDFILDGRVLVELKADLFASGDTDRALGQMLRYLLAWKDKGPAVLAVCGEAPPEIRFLVRVHVRTWRKQLNLPIIVFFKQDANEVSDEASMLPAQSSTLERGD